MLELEKNCFANFVISGCLKNIPNTIRYVNWFNERIKYQELLWEVIMK